MSMAGSLSVSEQTPPSGPGAARTARLIIVMGVSGCGKSTIGQALADRLGVRFLDGDLLHPPANIEKMSGGTPLTDEDRWPWMAIIANRMRETADEDGRVVGACSALKRSYRDFLQQQAGEPVLFVHLEGSRELIGARQANRPGHFMPASLLDSQFAALEPPAPDEPVVTVSVADPVDKIVDQVCVALT